jgi:hypothetical protein
MMRKFLCLIVVACTSGFVGAPRGQAGTASPSFACAASRSSAERIICASPKLAGEARLMARLFAFAQVSAFGSGPSSQVAAQREWLKSRDACAARYECLASSYAMRNEQLALTVLFSHPEIALPELHRLDPEGAPMFEAIYLYANARHLTEADRRRVIELLQPYADTPGGWGEPSNAVKSDTAFAEFIGVRSAGMAGDRDGRAFPCAAAIRKPKLVDATGPRFGSNMDNFVIQSDCPATLPPLPRFSALVDKRMTGMSDCGGGSIRYAYYSELRNAALTARLATAAQLHNKPAKPFPHRRNVSNADTSAAVEDLSAYYIRYGRANARQARPLARQMIYNMLEQAWQC